MMALFSSHTSSSRRSFSVGHLVRHFGNCGDGPSFVADVAAARSIEDYTAFYPMKKCRSHQSISQADCQLCGSDEVGFGITSAPENAICAIATDGDPVTCCPAPPASDSDTACCCAPLPPTQLRHSATSSTVMSSLSGACSPPANHHTHSYPQYQYQYQCPPDRVDSKSISEAAPSARHASLGSDQTCGCPGSGMYDSVSGAGTAAVSAAVAAAGVLPSGREAFRGLPPTEAATAAAAAMEDCGSSDLMGAFGVLTADQWSALHSAVSSDGGAGAARTAPRADAAAGAAGTATAAAAWPGPAQAANYECCPSAARPQPAQAVQPPGDSVGLRLGGDAGPSGPAPGPAAATSSSNEGMREERVSPGGSASSIASLWAAVNSAVASGVYDSTDDNVLAGQRPGPGMSGRGSVRLPSFTAAAAAGGRAPVVPCSDGRYSAAAAEAPYLPFRHTHHAGVAARGGGGGAACDQVAPGSPSYGGRGGGGGGGDDDTDVAARSTSCFAGSHVAQARHHLLQYGYFSHDPGHTSPFSTTSSSTAGGGAINPAHAALQEAAEAAVLTGRAHSRNSIDVGYYYPPSHHQAYHQLGPRSHQSQPQPFQGCVGQQPQQQQEQQYQSVSSAAAHQQQQQQQQQYHQQQYQHQHSGGAHVAPQQPYSYHHQQQQHLPSHLQPTQQQQQQQHPSTQLDSPSRRRNSVLSISTGPPAASYSYTTYGYRRAQSSLAAMEQQQQQGQGQHPFPRSGQGLGGGSTRGGPCECCSGSSSDDDTEEATRRITAAFRTHTGMLTRSSGWGLLGPDTAPSTPTGGDQAGRRDPWVSAAAAAGCGLAGGNRGEARGGVAAGSIGSGGVNSGGTQDGDPSAAASADDPEGLAGPLSRKRSGYHLTCSHAAVELFLRLNHARQTMDFVKRQTLLFAGLDKAELTVWEALHLLDELREYEAVLMADGGEAQDVASLSLLDHAFQTAELCRLHHPDLEWLHLVGLIHGLGKLLAHRRFGSQPQWAICGETYPLGCRFSPHILGSQYFTANPDRRRRLYNTPTGLYGPGCGLLNVVMSWSAPEYLYLVLMLNSSVQLPQDAVWVLRHSKFLTLTRPHSCYLPLCSPEDLRRLPLLRSFQQLAAYRRVTLPDGFGLQGEQRTAYYSGLVRKYLGEGRLRW